VSVLYGVEDSTQATGTQDWGVLDPCAQKIVRKAGTPFVEKFTSSRAGRACAYSLAEASSRDSTRNT
jgi:hypothetical protein